MAFSFERRFWAKVDKRGPDECWPWKATPDAYGYGVFTVDGRSYKATHIALLLAGKPRPGSLHALHSCDNRLCCNDAHLRWGTNDDNVKDKMARGRHFTPAGNDHWSRRDNHKVARGSHNGWAKLNEQSAREIFESSEPRRDLSARYGVSLNQISQIKLGRVWKHATIKENDFG